MTSATNSASFYADFSGLNALKRDARAEAPEALRAAARQFESLLTQMMLKSMRDATAGVGDSLAGGEDVDLYQGMFDQQLAVQMSQGKGLGLADMLVEQLVKTGLVKSDTAQAEQAGSADAQSDAAAVEAIGTEPQSTATTSAELSGPTREEFVKEIWPHAEKAAQQLGVDTKTVVAHAALETGWGQSLPRNADGSCSYNLFGIKANDRWSGASTASRTTEFESGTAVSRVERFRAYGSAAQSIADYAKLVGGSSRYAGATNSGSDVAQYATALQQGGYATDPNYAQKLQAVAGKVDALVGESG